MPNIQSVSDLLATPAGNLLCKHLLGLHFVSFDVLRINYGSSYLRLIKLTAAPGPPVLLFLHAHVLQPAPPRSWSINLRWFKNVSELRGDQPCAASSRQLE